MLTIRPEQIGVFAKSVEENLECRLVIHVSRVLPRVYAQMGEQAVRENVRRGMRRAATYGIESEYEVCRFVDLLFLLAADFDTDEQLAWASAILRNEALSEKVKMNELYERLGGQLSARQTGASQGAGPGGAMLPLKQKP